MRIVSESLTLLCDAGYCLPGLSSVADDHGCRMATLYNNASTFKVRLW